MAVKDQGALGTCYAAAASVAEQVMTGQDNSAIDIALHYSMRGLGKNQEISQGFGGDFCGAIQVANDNGLCDIKNSWLENTDPITSNGITARVDTNGKIGATFTSLFAFLDQRASLNAADWALLAQNAPTLMPQLVSQGGNVNLQAVNLQSVFSQYALMDVNFWAMSHRITTAEQKQIQKDLLMFDVKNGQNFLPAKSKYFTNRTSAAASLYKTYGPMITQIVQNDAPEIDLSTVAEWQPYLRQATYMMAEPHYIDQFRDQLAQYSAANSAIQTALQGCTDPNTVQDMMLKLVSVVVSSQNAGSDAALDPATFANIVFASQTAPENNVFEYATTPKCVDPANRIMTQKLSCTDHYSPNEVGNTRWIEMKMIQNLMKGQPLGLSYCAEALGAATMGTVTQSGSCGNHESLLTGIRYNPNTQRCDLLIWNSWGLNSAKTWIDTATLLTYTQGIQELGKNTQQATPVVTPNKIVTPIPNKMRRDLILPSAKLQQARY